ncbi:DUF4760 domain-containing protein [Streptomyces sp. enrichment culture]|uniref:DUF4760 domain-containing protein n=1 Tax=Streptomyces sp. enrichment culture TaxID=1795815 RepID=UPI003F573F34
MFNAAALAISIFSLLVSGVIAWRQLRSSQGANVLSIILDGFQETRTAEFSESIEYVLYHLTSAHPERISYVDLPEPAKQHVRRIGLFYDDLGKLVAHGLVDERLVIGSYGRSVLRAWAVLFPYVRAEREKHRRLAMPYFEDLAFRASKRSPEDVHRELGMKRFPVSEAMAREIGPPAEAD